MPAHIALSGEKMIEKTNSEKVNVAGAEAPATRFESRKNFFPLRPVAPLYLFLSALLYGNIAHAALVSYDFQLDFATNDQNTYGTGPTGAFTKDFFLGFDTQPNPFSFGGIEHVTSPKVVIIPGFLEIPAADLGDWGALIEGNFDLRTGFEITTRNDSGTIDASQSFLASLKYDDERVTGQYTNFNTFKVSQSQWMQTTFPNVGLDVDFAFQMEDTYINLTGCAVNCGTVALLPNTNINIDVPIFDYNRDRDGDGTPDGLVEIFGVGIDEEFAAYQTDTETVAGGEINTQPSLQLNLEIPTKKDLSLGYIRVDVPQAHTEAEELDGDSKLHSAAEDDFIEIGLDIDTYLGFIPGYGPIINKINSNGLTIPFTDLGVGYDLLNFNIAWDMDYSQEFTLLSNLVVDLEYSEKVLVDRGIFGTSWATAWSGAWVNMPDFTMLHEGEVTVTPTFNLNATLRNLTELDYDLTFILELLKLWYNLGVFGEGNVKLFEGEWPVDLFRSTVFDDTFALEGWNAVAASPFVVKFSQAPKTETLTCKSISGAYEYYSGLEPFWTPNWGTDPGPGPFGFLNPVHNSAWLQMLAALQSAYNTCNDPAQSFVDTCGSGLASLTHAGSFFPNDIFSGGEQMADTLKVANAECSNITPEPEVIVTVFEIPEYDPPACEDTQSCGDIVVGTKGVPTQLVFNQVPEPNILWLFFAGLVLVGFAMRRRS